MSRNKRGGGADHIYSQFGFEQINANDSIARETRIARLIARNITELAMNRFKWSGLPDSVDPRFLEMLLFRNALAIYYLDSEYDKQLVVRGSGAGWITAFDNPISFNVITSGLEIQVSGVSSNVMTSKVLPAYDRMRHSDLVQADKQKFCVPIWGNYTRTPDWDLVEIYSTRLAKLDRSIEINSSNARRSKILKGSPNMSLSVINANRQIDQGDDIIQVTGPMEDMAWVDAVDLGVSPDTYEKLDILRARVWNQCMGLLGIDNANQDKKERLVAAEVGANDSQTDSMRYVALNARQQACELINSIFDTNISVEFNAEIEAQAEQAEQESLNVINENDSEDESEKE